MTKVNGLQAASPHAESRGDRDVFKVLDAIPADNAYSRSPKVAAS